MLRVDIVVPVRNEERTIARFVAEVRALSLRDVDWNVLFVEDGSRDETLRVLRELAREDSRLRYYSLSRGYGEGPAVIFGLSRSDADAVIMMGVDGSHPPARIPELIRAFQDGAQVVQCVRRSFAGRPWWRDAGTRLFGVLTRALTGEHFEHQNVYFRLVSRSIADRLLAQPRYWRFLRFPLPDPASGALRTIEVPMTERSEGASEYTPLRLLGVALDGLLSLASAPRLALLAGTAFAVAVALWAAGAAFASAALAAVAAAAVYRWVRLGRTDYLARFTLREGTDDQLL